MFQMVGIFTITKQEWSSKLVLPGRRPGLTFYPELVVTAVTAIFTNAVYFYAGKFVISAF